MKIDHGDFVSVGIFSILFYRGSDATGFLRYRSIFHGWLVCLRGDFLDDLDRCFLYAVVWWLIICIDSLLFSYSFSDHGLNEHISTNLLCERRDRRRIVRFTDVLLQVHSVDTMHLYQILAIICL